MIAVCERPPHAVSESATVGMEESSGETVRVLTDDKALPRLQLDPSVMLLAKAVLRDQARPVPWVGSDVAAAVTLHPSHPVVRAKCLDGMLALAKQARPGIRTRDSKHPGSSCWRTIGAYAAVAQIEPSK